MHVYCQKEVSLSVGNQFFITTDRFLLLRLSDNLMKSADDQAIYAGRGILLVHLAHHLF
jgi:hypothetical protein